MKKVAVITGASSGIGRELVQCLKDSHHLILCGRKLNELELSAKNLNSDNYDIVQLDLNDNNSIKKAAQLIVIKHSKINLLFNNAGISQRSLAFETKESVEQKLMQVNYFGPVLLTKLLLPNIRLAKGRIAVTSSIVGKFGFPLRSTYSAAKHALHGFFESLRLEEEKYSVFVQLFVIGRANTKVSLNAMTEKGDNYGVMDKGQFDGLSAEDCAQRMVKALSKNKKEVLIGGKEIWMVRFKKFVPFLFYKLASKQTNHV